MTTPAEVHEHQLKVLAAAEEGILHDLDGLLMGAYNLYDVGRAIPHPYDALGGMANGYLHDLKGTAYKIKRYINLVTAELAEQASETKEESQPEGGPR